MNNNVKNSFGVRDSNDKNPNKDNINNKLSEEKDYNKSDDSDSAKNNNQKNWEEINTDLDNNNIFFDNPTIESKSKSSENEE